MPKTFNPVDDIPDLSGKTIVITGGNAGLGAATVAAVAAHSPAHIFLTARRRAAAEEFVETIKTVSSSTVITVIDLDLASFVSVKAAAAKIIAGTSRLDLLVLNAGIASVAPSLTAEGYEMQFGTNHMGHALLTQLLMPVLLETAAQPGADVRVVVLSSDAHRTFGFASGIEFDALKTDMAGKWEMKLYGQSKLANSLFAHSLAAKYPQITAVSVHPGMVNTTIMEKATGGHWLLQKIVVALVPFVGATVDTGVKNQLWACFADDVVNGAYYEPVGKLGTENKLMKDGKLAEKLWAWTDHELQAHLGTGWPNTK